MRHIALTCKNHPHLRWTAKSIAVNRDGSYNGRRNIFFDDCMIIDGKIQRECDCPPSMLTFADDSQRTLWEECAKAGH